MEDSIEQIKTSSLTSIQFLEIVSRVVKELNPLTPYDRARVLQNAKLVFDDSNVIAESKKEIPMENNTCLEVSPVAAEWVKKYNLSEREMRSVFNISSNGVSVIASMPGRRTSEKVLEAYVLTGICSFLKLGNSDFSDRDARALCTRMGFYDSANHNKYMSFSNYIMGSKQAGFSLTFPGLEFAVNVIRKAAATSVPKQEVQD